MQTDISFNGSSNSTDDDINHNTTCNNDNIKFLLNDPFSARVRELKNVKKITIKFLLHK